MDSQLLISKNITLCVKATHTTYTSQEDYRNLLSNVRESMFKKDMRPEDMILRAKSFLNEEKYIDNIDFTAQLFELTYGGGKINFFKKLRSNGELKTYNLGQALRLMNELFKFDLLKKSNNKIFIFFLTAPQTEALVWVGIHRGNSRKYKFWFDEEDLFMRGGIGHYFIS